MKRLLSRSRKVITVKDVSKANDESVLDYWELQLDYFVVSDVNNLRKRYKSIVNE